MERIKFYAWAIAAAVGAILLAIIRHKNNKIGELQSKAETNKHEVNIKLKTQELAKATEQAAKSRDKFKQWQAEHGKKFGNVPPEGEL